MPHCSYKYFSEYQGNQVKIIKWENNELGKTKFSLYSFYWSNLIILIVSSDDVRALVPMWL